MKKYKIPLPSLTNKFFTSYSSAESYVLRSIDRGIDSGEDFFEENVKTLPIYSTSAFNTTITQNSLFNTILKCVANLRMYVEESQATRFNVSVTTQDIIFEYETQSVDEGKECFLGMFIGKKTGNIYLSDCGDDIIISNISDVFPITISPRRFIYILQQAKFTYTLESFISKVLYDSSSVSFIRKLVSRTPRATDGLVKAIEWNFQAFRLISLNLRSLGSMLHRLMLVRGNYHKMVSSEEDISFISYISSPDYKVSNPNIPVNTIQRSIPYEFDNIEDPIDNLDSNITKQYGQKISLIISMFPKEDVFSVESFREKYKDLLPSNIAIKSNLEEYIEEIPDLKVFRYKSKVIFRHNLQRNSFTDFMLLSFLLQD